MGNSHFKGSWPRGSAGKERGHSTHLEACFQAISHAGSELRASDGTKACSHACSNPVLEYVCPSCGARYTTLQAASLINYSDGEFHCEHCDSVLRSGRDDGAANGGEGARQLRLKATKLLQACPLHTPIRFAKNKYYPLYLGYGPHW